MRRLLAAMVVCALAGFAAPAGAAQGAWAGPADLSATGQSASNPHLAIAPDGTATAVWSRYNGSNYIIQASVRPPGGVFATPVDLSPVGQSSYFPQVAVASDGTTTAVWSRRSPGNRYIAQASTRAPGGAFGAPVDLSADGGHAFDPQVAFAPDGTTTVVWSRTGVTPSTPWIVQASTRPPGGAFGATEDLSATSQDATAPQIAIAQDGAATVVWKRSDGTNTIVQATTRPAGGGFSTPLPLSAAGQDAQAPHVAVAPDGSATVVWYRSNGTHDIVQASSRAAGGAFGAAVDLSASGQPGDSPRVGVASDGTTTVVWRRSNGANTIVQASTRAPGGAFGTPVDLSGTGQNAEGPRVAVAPDGTATAVWERSDGANTIVQSATREANAPPGSFGAPQNLSAAGRDAEQQQVVAGPNGTWMATWRRANGSNYIAQAADRGPLPQATASPAIGGVAVVGQTLTCSAGTWTGASQTSLAWLRDGVQAATGATYTVAPADVGTALSCRVTATNAYGSTSATTASVSVAMVPAPAPDGQPAPPATPVTATLRPAPRSLPRILGLPELGRTLSCRAATFAHATKRSTRWLRGSTPIKRATQRMYTITTRDLGKAISCRTKAIGPGGTAYSTSAPVRPVRG